MHAEMNTRSNAKDEALCSSDAAVCNVGPSPASRPRFEFPFKLHTILEDAAREGQEWIISWLSHGKAFKVHSRKDFETYILPRYFSAPKYRSFQRQLAMYGFKLVRDRNSDDFRAYYNELFVRGEPDLCKDMMRHVNTSPTRRRRRNKKKVAAPGATKATMSEMIPTKTPSHDGAAATSEAISGPIGGYNGVPQFSHECFFPTMTNYTGRDSLIGQPQPSPGTPPYNSTQQDFDLLQFSIEANNFMELSSRAPTDAPTIQDNEVLPKAPPSVPGPISCSMISDRSSSSNNTSSSPSRRSSQQVFHYGGKSLNRPTPEMTESSSKHGALHQSNVKVMTPSLGTFFDNGCSLQKPQDPNGAVVTANMLAEIGESLMSSEFQNVQDHNCNFDKTLS